MAWQSYIDISKKAVATLTRTKFSVIICLPTYKVLVQNVLVLLNFGQNAFEPWIYLYVVHAT